MPDLSRRLTLRARRNVAFSGNPLLDLRHSTGPRRRNNALHHRKRDLRRNSGLHHRNDQLRSNALRRRKSETVADASPICVD
jgi:hypothetical protein